MNEFKCPICNTRVVYDPDKRALKCLNDHPFDPLTIPDAGDDESNGREALESIEMTEEDRLRYGHVIGSR